MGKTCLVDRYLNGKYRDTTPVCPWREGRKEALSCLRPRLTKKRVGWGHPVRVGVT